MAKGTLDKPVEISIEVLKGIPYTDRSFVLAIPVHNLHGRNIGTMPVAYFGQRKGNRFIINSFSYSIKFLPKCIGDLYNKDPELTARYGLGLHGVLMIW